MSSREPHTETAEERTKRAESYRLRAEELRAVAQHMNTTEARVALLEMSADYEHMAQILTKDQADTHGEQGSD